MFKDKEDFMKRFPKLLTTFLLTFLLAGGMALHSQNAATAKAETALGWNLSSGKVTFYYTTKGGTTTQAKNVSVKVSERTLTSGSTAYKFHAGIYTFNASGTLVTGSVSAKDSRKLIVLDTNYKETSESGKTYLFSKKGAVSTTTAVTTSASGTTKATTYTAVSTLFTGQYNSKVYADGSLLSGYALKSNSKLYTVTGGVYKSKFTGTLTSSYVNATTGKLCAATNKYYKSGVLFTGIANLKYYKKGVFTKKNGWKNISGSRYYLKKGKAVTGWKYIKDYSKSKTKYKYYFKKNGKLVTDLFKYFGSSYKKKRLKIRLNLTTHNITIFLYDSAKKKYDIPAKTFVCSTARDGKSTYTGNHYLSKGTARRWFIYKKSKPYHYYQYGVHVAGTKSWIHSEMYRTTSNKRLIASTYNGLGTNQTTACIRVQAGNAKLVYDIAKKNKYSVPVQIYRSSNKGPFGKITLADTTGKIASSQNYDPTDPAFK